MSRLASFPVRSSIAVLALCLGACAAQRPTDSATTAALESVLAGPHRSAEEDVPRPQGSCDRMERPRRDGVEADPEAARDLLHAHGVEVVASRHGPCL